jgi:glycosyltransferase involved in cell wall biosynthesis
MNHPLVSVLIPTYNSAAYLDRALASAAAQTHQNLQIVVQDNASTDATWDIGTRWSAADPRISCERNHDNVGPLRNWQAGLKRCTGSYIKVLWSDDWMEPTCIAECVARLERARDSALVFTAVIVHHADYDDAFYLHAKTTCFSTEEYVRASALWKNMPVSPGAAMVRASAVSFDLPGGVSDHLAATAARTGAGPDLFFLLHAALAGERVLHVPKLLNHFQGRPDSLTGLHTDAVLEAYNELLAFVVSTLTTTRFPRLARQVRIAHLKRRAGARLHRLQGYVGRVIERLSGAESD